MADETLLCWEECVVLRDLRLCLGGEKGREVKGFSFKINLLIFLFWLTKKIRTICLTKFLFHTIVAMLSPLLYHSSLSYLHFLFQHEPREKLLDLLILLFCSLSLSCSLFLYIPILHAMQDTWPWSIWQNCTHRNDIDFYLCYFMNDTFSLNV